MTDIVARLRGWQGKLPAMTVDLRTLTAEAAAEIERLREALMALQDAYRDVEMAMPTEQGKAATLAWMKAARALKETGK